MQLLIRIIIFVKRKYYDKILKNNEYFDKRTFNKIDCVTSTVLKAKKGN